MAQTPTTDAATEADTDAQIARIDAMTMNGRSNWFGLMAYLAFVLITVLGVEDVDFFDPGRNTALPLIGVSIPTFSFFVFAPVLAAALYVYLHLTLRKATEALCKAPHRIGADALEERIKPWLLNDMVLRMRGTDAAGRRAATPRPLDPFATLSVIALIWLAGPALLALMWVRSWPAHDWVLSLTIATALFITVFAGITTWLKMGADLGRDDGGFGTLVRDVGLTIVAMAVLMTTLQQTFLGVQQSDGPPRLAGADLSGSRLSVLPPDLADPVAAQQRYRADWCRRLSLPGDICGTLPVPGAETAGAIWSGRSRWCAENGIADAGPDACRDWFTARDDDFREEWTEYRDAVIAALPKPDLSGRDLRAADLSDAEAVGINFADARLEGADLSEARLEGADLTGAWMQGAVLQEALLDRADLSQARLDGADLSEARLSGADLEEAGLEDAVLHNAQLDGAKLGEARMQNADFSEAHMAGAVFRRARMEGAVLYEAHVEGADFTEARMEGALLYGARMDRANLSGARMEGAILSAASMERALLYGTWIQGAVLTEARLNGAILFGARMEGAFMYGAWLQGTVLTGARMDGANLRGARMEGAVLTGTRMMNVNWASASTNASLAQFADFRGGLGLDQARLSSLIGNAATLLPEAPEGQADLYIASCWADDPPGFEHLVAGQARHGLSAAELRDPSRGFFCAPGEVPRKTGTPWPVDADPPWGAQGTSEDDVSYWQRMDAWAKNRPSGDPID